MAGRITKADAQLKPDPKFGDLVLARFINCMMLGGGKATAFRLVYNAFDEIQKRLDDGKAPDLPPTCPPPGRNLSQKEFQELHMLASHTQ